MTPKTYYTIIKSDGTPWTNVIDDMNTTEIWAIGGMFWDSRKKATACMKNLKGYFPKEKFKVISFIL